MIELTKGDPDNLEGKVTIYSKFSGDIRDFAPPKLKNAILNPFDQIFSLYTTTDILDFIEKECLPSELAKEIKRKIEAETKHLFEKRHFSEKIICFYSHPGIQENEQEVICSPHDVLYAGKWKSLLNCIISLNHASELYMNRFTEQKINNLGINHSQNQAEKDLQEKKIDKDRIGEYIMKRYIGSMMDANRRGEFEEFNRLQSGLIQIGRIPEFKTCSHDLFKLCSALKASPGRNADITLITAYVNKIQAISLERYEEAAKLRDKIKYLQENH